ncbi:uncharacterized protein PITG_17422 [Phytophthora infestans T30-4]|uniref:Uncharacterized protein n=1 Tax=Phytophthora infestans (strain T30-4) TaxID=403677 RepID=D0NW15_PHYIT|nr:uncharacterized protein PITG_17422 [Phytophthora infestans T30-4]EEY66851.1 hypothetical protein PITG_17422 [Phytophthora infestans T30-4]|eukprot:XP_002896738.1 hypothetical protein PITG_17422 [Phytophthora infestans T30-4]
MPKWHNKKTAAFVHTYGWNKYFVWLYGVTFVDCSSERPNSRQRVLSPTSGAAAVEAARKRRHRELVNRLYYIAIY